MRQKSSKKEKTDSISFALLGAGSVGQGVFHQSLLTRHVDCTVVCDRDMEKALALNDPRRRFKVVSTEGELADALKRGEIAVCQDARLAATAPALMFCSTHQPRSIPRPIQ